MPFENEDRQEATPADSTTLTETQAVDRLQKLFASESPKTTNREESQEDETADASATVPEDDGLDAAPTESEETETEAEEDQEDGDDDKPQQPAKKQSFDLSAKIALDDGTEVTVDELRRGYYRQADYTRKTQEVAAERQNVQASYQRLQHEAQQLQAHLEMLAEFKRQILPPEPDQRLIGQDDYLFMTQRNAREVAEKRLQAIEQTRHYYVQKQQAEQQQAMQQAWHHAKTTLFTEMPELQDPVKMSSFLQKANKALAKYGFSTDDMVNTPDPRNWRVAAVLIKAEENSERLKSSLQKNKNVPPVQKPGKRSSSESNLRASVAKAEERLSRSNRQEDAVALLMARDRIR